MNRRAPVRSVLAERRMFANGGMLPISKPIQNNMNQPAGILASSQPLIEAVAQDAVNPMGGGTLSMAQGGVVGFQQGGVGLWPLESPPSLGEREVRFLEAQTQRELEKNAALRELNERGAAPGLTAEVVNLAGTDPGMPFGPIRLIAEAPKDLTVAEQVKRRLPDPAYKPVVPASELGSITIGDRRIFANTLADALSVRTGLLGKLKTFENTIAEDFLSKYDEVNLSGPEKEKRALERREASAKKLGFASYEALQAQKRELENIPLSSWLGAVNADERTMDYFSNPDNIPKNLRRYFATATTEKTAEGPPAPPAKITAGRTDAEKAAAAAAFPFVEDATLYGGDGRTDAEKAAAAAAAAENAMSSRGFVEDATLYGGDGRTDATGDGRTDAEKAAAAAAFPFVEDATLYGGDGRTDATGDGRTDTEPQITSPKRATDETLLRIADAAENRNVDRDMDFFKNRFIDSVGEYQGKTESEKGMDFIKLGMAIASGKSPNAISNISNGVLATIDTFSVDDKQKRAFERQVNLSAAQYALSAIAKDEAQLEADRRKGFFFYDQDKKSKEKPFGELVRLSMADILANDGKIPDNLIEKELILKDIAASRLAAKTIKETVRDNAKLYRITAEKEKELRGRVDKINTALISSVVGEKLLGSVIGQVASDDITGVANAGKDLYRRALVAAGVSPDKKWTNIEEARADVKRAFQLLIPLTLGTAQTANSISNRDVEFLANAYVDQAFLTDGVFGFSTISNKILAKRLQGALQQFSDARVSALADYDDVLSTLRRSEEGLARYQAVDPSIDPGMYGRVGLKSTLDEAELLATAARDKQKSGTQVKELGWLYEEDSNKKGTYRMKGAPGTNFAGKFFKPSDLPKLKYLEQ